MTAPKVSKRIYLIDDDPAVRHGISALLLAAGYSVTDFASANAFVEQIPRLDLGSAIVLADICMPGIQGLELQEKLATGHPEARVIVMTAHGDIAMAVRAMRNGAVDFLEKPFSAGEITTALARAFARSPAVPKTVNARSAHAQDYDSLTARERDVLWEMIKGNTNKVIARDLCISPRTVEVHRQKVMHKMRAGSFAELVRMAVELDPVR